MTRKEILKIIDGVGYLELKSEQILDEMPQLPCRKIVFEKDFIPPENKFYEHTDLNTFVMSITLRSPNEIRQIYCYPNSPFAKEYEKIIASTEDDGCSYADVLKCNYLPDEQSQKDTDSRQYFPFSK